MALRSTIFLGPRAENLDGVLLSIEESANDELVTISTNEGFEGIATGAIDNPSIYLKWQPCTSKNAADLHFLGFQCCEFALPVRASSTDLDFNFFSRPKYTRPHSIFPLFVFNRSTNECILLAPMDHFHHQVLSVNIQGEKELRWGWSGDLDRIPKQFSTTLGIFHGTSPRELLNRWGAHLQRRAGKLASGMLPGRYADVCTAKLSMWTDNGAAYWYRTEAGLDLPTTIEQTVKKLDDGAVPVHSIELDSWFYEHEVSRNITDVGYLDIVPPTGMLRWEPRKDALGSGGIAGLRKRVSNRPLVLHSRHISSSSSYRNEDALADAEWWVDKDRAHPSSPALFRRWMQQAADWGATAYEQDWLVEIWQGVRQLREEPGRIAEWHRMLDDAAQENNINLIWCMATPADMALAVSLKRVVALRTSDDYRYAEDAADLWRWHLTVNCIAKALGQWPFKDVFLSHDNHKEKVDIEGDPNAELEALLAALSAGPVGIGDRMGRTNKEIVMRTCRSDGVLIKPDLPLCAMDRSLQDGSGLLWTDTWSGEWRYVVAINASRKADAAKNGEAGLVEELDIGDGVLVYDWKTKKAEVTSTIIADLRAHEWGFWVVCPVRSGDVPFSVIGDTSVYATMGDRRIRVNKPFAKEPSASSAPSMDVVGTPNEIVPVSYWTEGKGVGTVDITIGTAAWTRIEFPV